MSTDFSEVQWCQQESNVENTPVCDWMQEDARRQGSVQSCSKHRKMNKGRDRRKRKEQRHTCDVKQHEGNEWESNSFL